MTTALALKGKKELTELEQAILAETQDDVNAFDYIPTRIKFPSGDVNAFITNDGDMLKPPFTAIIAVSQKARAFWPNKDTQGIPPLCASPDGVRGWFDTESDQAKDAALLHVKHPALGKLDNGGPYDCARCPLAQWGSGDGRGQACKSLRRLMVLVDGWSMPAILTVPPTSIKALDFYASARARTRGQSYFTTWTEFGLSEKKSDSTNIKYKVLTLTPGRALDEAETAEVIAIRHQYAQMVRELGITGEDYDTGGDIVEQSVEPDSDEEIAPF